MRARYRDPNQRRGLLEEWDLADDPRFQLGEEFWLPVADEPGIRLGLQLTVEAREEIERAGSLCRERTPA